MALLFKGGFLVLFAFLLAVSEAARSALRCVRENNSDSKGSGCYAAGQSQSLGVATSPRESLGIVEARVKLKGVRVLRRPEQPVSTKLPALLFRSSFGTRGSRGFSLFSLSIKIKSRSKCLKSPFGVKIDSILK